MASLWQDAPASDGSTITFSWQHGGTPSQYLEALRVDAEALLVDKSTPNPNVGAFMDVAQRLYLPVPVRVSLSSSASGGPPPNEADDVVEDLWTAVYLATLTQDCMHLVWILKFHASLAKRIMNELSNRRLQEIARIAPPTAVPLSLMDCIGDEGRALLIDACCCNAEDESDELTVGCVARGLVPFFKALVASSPEGQPLTAHRAAIKAFMDSLHDESLVPTSPSLLSGGGHQTLIKRRNSTSLTSTSDEGGGQCTDATGKKNDAWCPNDSDAPRYRHQLFVDCAALFEDVCELGKLALLSKLQERLPIGPVFFVSFDHAAYASVVANLPTAALAEFATFAVAPQEAIKLCFYHQCFPELPSPVASLRAIVNQQKAAIMNRSGRRGSMPKPIDNNNMGSGGVTLLHFRILRRLVARTHDIRYFKEYVSLLERELFQDDDATLRGGAVGGHLQRLVGEIPVCIPALYGAAAEFAFRPEPMTTQIVLDKLAWLLSRSEDVALQSYMLTTCNNDAARFSELWVSETHVHGAKKFKTRGEMLAFAVTLFRLVTPPPPPLPPQPVSSNSGASNNNNSTTPPLQRRASMGAFAQPGGGGNSNSASSVSAQQQATNVQWAHIWETFFARLASTTAASLAELNSDTASENVLDQRAHIDELVGSLKGIIRLLREASGRSGDEDDSDGDHADGTETSGAGGDAGVLQRRFERAQKGFEGVAGKQPNNVKLRFYGLFKQATVGDINIDRPWAMDVAGRAKYDAWAACKGKTTAEAMQCYVDQWSLLAATI